MSTSIEKERIDAEAARSADWKQWGPYLSERQWATVRSDQTGWTGVIARAMHLFTTVTPEQLLKGGRNAYFDSIANVPFANSKRQTNL
jgi:hypothetical protein